ncbi:hypothetical protein MMC07_002858 [Pseudocyphellaria aurata]|nr:hypothetical protein [Pseudocyphellaria aurata]
MAFGRRPEKNKARPGFANPSPRFPIQANIQQAKPEVQPSNTLTVRPHFSPPISTRRHDGGNHAYTAPPATTYSPRTAWGQSTSQSYQTQITGEVPETWHENTVQGPTLCDLITSKFDAVLTSIDGETFNGDERELVIHEDPQPLIRGGWGSASREVSRGANRAISSAVISTNYFSKAYFYANSRLPPNLPPLNLYLPSYPLVCLAAQYSQRAYMKPTGREREAHVDANWRMGTKAMVIKSVPIDDMNTIIFAIRGSQTFMDWAVNLNSAPVSPSGFLDDPGNLCHSGFLSVARRMIKPVAARLRSLLEEDPSRTGCSLLITGHSAGGAIASLLYAHMLAEQAGSELGILADCKYSLFFPPSAPAANKIMSVTLAGFKRIHCITFGTPPLSLLPLTKPHSPRHTKSLFLSFINEGDPVPRADKAYVRSLLDLYTSPLPGSNCMTRMLPSAPRPRLALKAAIKPGKRPIVSRTSSAPARPEPARSWCWRVPPGVLSNAGRLVVLRATPNGNGGAEDDVKAELTTDAQLRGVVFGDPIMHMMKLYARRVEVLATKAVTAKIWE